jgi:hypothetical protein
MDERRADHIRFSVDFARAAKIGGARPTSLLVTLDESLFRWAMSHECVSLKPEEEPLERPKDTIQDTKNAKCQCVEHFQLPTRPISSKRGNLQQAMPLVSMGKWTIIAISHVTDRTAHCELAPVVELSKNACLTNEIDSLERLCVQYVNSLVLEPVSQPIVPMVDFQSGLARFCTNRRINSGRMVPEQRPMIGELNISSVVAMLSQMFLRQSRY